MQCAVFTAVLQLQLEGPLVSPGDGVSLFAFAYPPTELLAWKKGRSLSLHQEMARKFVPTFKCSSFKVTVNIPGDVLLAFLLLASRSWPGCGAQLYPCVYCWEKRDA